MKKIFWLIWALPLNLFGQNTIGLPEIINYPKEIYKAGLQNWDIKQDTQGIIYFANNEGLLTFDGNTWELFPLPNKTIVRSLEISTDGRIYVGGQDEIGYFAPNEVGELKYTSIIDKIAPKDRSFGDLWDIVKFKHHLFFRTSNKIFKLTGGKIEIYYPRSEWLFLGAANDQLYAYDRLTGLKKFEENTWQTVANNSVLPKSTIPTAALNIGNGNTLITTLKNGLFICNTTGIYPFASKYTNVFGNERIYSAINISSDLIAIATSNGGIYILDKKGNIIQSFSQKEGLQNNNVLSVFSDKQKNLWLGLDNGIDFVAFNSPIKQINPFLLDASGYAAMFYQNKLWLGTSNGLYYTNSTNSNDLSFSKSPFVFVKKSEGQTWSLAKINDKLLLAHHEGAYVIKGNQAIPIDQSTGYWNFSPVSFGLPNSGIVAGTYSGIALLTTSKSDPNRTGKVANFQESSRFITTDRDYNIWVSHPYHGIFKLKKTATGNYQTKVYTQKDGLPSNLNNYIYKIDGDILAATEKGIYEFRKGENRFVASAYYQGLLGTKNIRYLKEDDYGNLWFIQEKSLGVIDNSGQKAQIIFLPELTNKLLSGFEMIYPLSQENIIVSGEKGFFNINFEKYKKNINKLEVSIRKVIINNQKDSVIFGGYIQSSITNQVTREKTYPKVNSDWQTIKFAFTSNLMGNQSTIEYSYRLTGLSDDWSEWTNKTEKEFTVLPPNNYTFEVKARNHLGVESAVSVYRFEITPPWYLTIWAKMVYAALAIAFFSSLQKKYKQKLRIQQLKYEEEQQKLKYIHDLELNKSESELVNLRNQKLEADINLVNSELASAAMHLVKKGELLTKSKEELTKVLKMVDNPEAINELKKMMKKLNEDEKMDQEWENFTRHFNKVHSDFLTALKSKHPTITSNELKLCAYLRMNLSTKEIAQLSNISVRGVEISRYRLRKKLEISSETSLIDYLITFKY